MSKLIKESQIREFVKKEILQLKEAMMNGFSFDELKGKSFAYKMKYCQQMCGKHIGKGSSRIVYQIDDNWVLKLACNEKGIAQNEEEFKIATDNYGSELSVRVDKNRTDTDGFEWLVSEYVLPSKAQDFKKVYGVDWKDVCLYAQNLDKGGNVINQLYDKYEENEDAINLFNEIHEYWANWDGALGDVSRLANWGLCMRDGSPEMVLLDIGASMDIIQQYYRR